MRSLVAVAAVLSLQAASASAESLVSTRSGDWNDVAGGSVTWAGGTPSPDDDFTIASGHKVTIAGGVQLTTGSITVASRGSLTVPAGASLTPGDRLVVQSGGRYTQQGEVIDTCTITQEPNWNGVNPIVQLSCSTQDIEPSEHMLVFLAKDPKDGDWTRGTVFVGPGGKKGNTALNRYAWYEITAADVAAITYDLDSGSYGDVPGAPYQGTRGNPTPTPIAAAQLDFVAQPGRRATRVDVDPGYGSVVAMNADLGSYYLYFTEDSTNAMDPTRCSGLAAKILHSEDGGAGADRIYVAGDVTGCTHESVQARIIPGARRGDRVALVRPARVDGFVDGSHVSHVRFESGANLRVSWARFTRLGYVTPTEVTPPLRRNCNVCFLQSESAPAAPYKGFFEDVEIDLAEAGTGLTNDTSILHFDSLDGGTNPDYRFPDAGLLDMTKFRIARLHIHDNRNEASTGGGHGIYVDGVKNLVIDGARIERTSDDLFGSNLGGNETGAANDANSLDVRRLLLYEGVAEHDNSQECFEPTVIFGDGPTATGIHNYERQAGAIRARDVIALGCYAEPVNVVGLGAQVDRIVSGGQFDASETRPVQFFVLPGSGISPAAFPNVARNAVFTTYGEDGTNAVLPPFMLARLEDSVLFGDEQSADAGNRHEGFQACIRSFWFHAGSDTFALEGNSTSENVWSPLREWEDCAFVSATADRLGGNFSNFADPHTLRFERFLYLQTPAWNATGGALGPITTEPLATLDLSGAFLSTEQPGNKDFDANLGGTVENVCYESNNDAATDFQTYASATTLSLPALAPDVSDSPAVGELVGDPTSADVCEQNKPAALGLAEVGTAHVLLGDFAVSQLYPIYTSRRGLVKLASEGPIPE